jgi:hypothetical protein
MVGYGVQARLSRGKVGANAVATYELVRDVLIAGLKSGGAQVVSDAEVLGWWSVVHGLAFLAIDGHLGKAGTSSNHARLIVRNVLKGSTGTSDARRGSQSRNCQRTSNTCGVQYC